MRKIMKIMALLLTLVAASPAFAGGDTYRLYVDGLACPYCAYGVEKQVGSLEGVESVDIRINDGVVAVTMAPGARLTEEQARQAVADAGFSLRKFERTAGK